MFQSARNVVPIFSLVKIIAKKGCLFVFSARVAMSYFNKRIAIFDFFLPFSRARGNQTFIFHFFAVHNLVGPAKVKSLFLPPIYGPHWPGCARPLPLSCPTWVPGYPRRPRCSACTSRRPSPPGPTTGCAPARPATHRSVTRANRFVRLICSHF